MPQLISIVFSDRTRPAYFHWPLIKALEVAIPKYLVRLKFLQALKAALFLTKYPVDLGLFGSVEMVFSK